VTYDSEDNLTGDSQPYADGTGDDEEMIIESESVTLAPDDEAAATPVSPGSIGPYATSGRSDASGTFTTDDDNSTVKTGTDWDSPTGTGVTSGSTSADDQP